MNRIIFALFVMSGILLTITGCVKEITSDLNYGIDPHTQVDLLCKSLRVNGNNIDGSMPVGLGIGAPLVVSYPTAVEVSAGVLLFIPYQIDNPNQVCEVYLQVEGANNYWRTKLNLDPSSGQPYFQILIPKIVSEGNFDLVFSLADCQGNVSPIYSTRTIVSPNADCSTGISGSVGITVRAFDLGDTPGLAGFNYEMYSIPDRMDIRYNGEWVASTGQIFNSSVIIPDCSTNDGFVSGSGTLTFQYSPSVSRFVEVYVSGCFSGTLWDVFPVCPQ